MEQKKVILSSGEEMQLDSDSWALSRYKEKTILRESNPIPSGEESEARPVEPAEQEKK